MRRLTIDRFPIVLAALLLSALPLTTFAVDLVGTVPGSFDVSQTGSATYTIPIELRTGTGGMRPPISLRYAHRGGHGVAGQNWTLTGVSRIDRCRKTLDQDGAAGGVKYDNTDKFCLDGRRLVSIVGTYGAAGSEYRTEIDSFKKIVAYQSVGGGPRYFIVTDRDGTKHWYGDLQQSSLTHPTTGAYRFWARYRTEDTYGNQINYFYSANAYSGEFLLDKVEYTANPAQGLSARYRVNMVYEVRPSSDQRDGYRYGATWSHNKRLEKITHSILGAGSGLIHEYTLEYATASSGRSQLISVKQCRATDCFPASTFTWQDAVVGWDNLTSTGNASSQAGPKVGDFNGDGQKDLFVVAGGNWHILLASGGSLSAPFDTGVASQDWVAAKLGDLDGDGKTDILFRGSDSDWHVYRSTGVATTGQAFTDIDTGESTTGVASFVFQDVDGDSRDDVLYQSGQSIYLRKSTGNDLATTASNVYTSSDMDSITGKNPIFSSKARLDFDGDGLSDLVENRVEVIDIDPENIVYKYYHVPLTFNGTTFTAGPLIQVFNPTLRYVDINGDGLLDVAYPEYFSNGTWHIRISNGSGFGSAVSTGINCTWFSSVAFADYDSDGRMDFICPSTGNWTLYKSTGANFSSTSINLGSFSGATKGTPMDVTGNGQDDIVVRASNLWQIRKHKSGLVDVVTRFEDGLGNYVEPVHEPVSTSNHYSQSYFGTPPEDRSYQEPLYVVTDYTANDGKGGTYTNEIVYYGAKMHLRGRGFLGFYQVREVDYRGSGYRIDRRLYDQEFPETGMLLQRELRVDNWNNLRELVVNTLQSDSPHAGIYFPRVESTLHRTYEIGGTHNGQIVQEVVDNPGYNTTYGHPNSRTITTTSPIRPSESFVTTFGYTQNPSVTDWCLDKPSATSVTRNDHINTPVVRTFTHTYDTPKCRALTTSNTTGSDNNKKLKVTNTYDVYGNLKTQTLDNISGTADDRQSEYVYDTYGEKPIKLIQHISAGPNPETQWAWDYINGQPSTITDGQGQATTRTFDGLGRLDVETYADGTSVNYDYLNCVDCWITGVGRFEVRVTPSASPAARNFFDRYGRVIGQNRDILGGADRRITNVYDQQGRIYRAYGPWINGETPFYTQYSYDLIGRTTEIDRPISETTPTGALTQIDYDGDEQTVTNSEGQITKYEFDAAGQLVKITDDLAGTTHYEYAAFGQLHEVTDPDGALTTMNYNERGWKTSMTAPDMGTWSYDYNAFDELIWQQDAKSQVVQYNYNQLGLPTTRTEPEGTTTWAYHTSADHRLWLQSSITSPGFYESYSYDSLSRPNSTTTTLDSVNYVTNLTYHSTGSGRGKLKRIEYPDSTSGYNLLADYEYDSMGSLVRVVDGNSPSTVWYELNETDSLGQARHGTFGNNLDEVLDYDDATHRLKTIKTGPGLSSSIQNLRYYWDTLGNLTQRNDDRQSLTETFTYDDLNRLDTVLLGAVNTLSIGYSPGGNVQTKSDVGTYHYSSLSKAVDSITGTRAATYQYDANGNRTHRNSDLTTWFSYNLPERINYGSDYADFEYGAYRARTKQVAKTGANTTTTWYVGGHFEREFSGGVTTYRHNILFGGNTVAIVERPTAGANTTTYVHRDHMQNVETLTDPAQSVVQRMSFDAFGKRRNLNWTADSSDLRFADSHTSERGYTGHEHLDNVRMVHMNGRVLDPIIGRVISADPFVPNPFNGQSYNRMSYVQNNPLSLIDPSGFSEAPPGHTPGDGLCSFFGLDCTHTHNWQDFDFEPDKSGYILPPPGWLSTPPPGPGSVSPSESRNHYGPRSGISPDGRPFTSCWMCPAMYTDTGEIVQLSDLAGERPDLVTSMASSMVNAQRAKREGDTQGYVVGTAGWVTYGALILLEQRLGGRGRGAAGGVRPGPAANNGIARPHGGARHNDAIDQRIEALRSDTAVTNIRKNQVQVDVNGNRVGNNRPDVQFNRCGVHHCVEYDTVPANGARHGDVIRRNDPNAAVELNDL